MQRKFNLGSLIGTVVMVGVLVSFFAGDSELQAIFQGLEPHQVEALLEYLDLGLAFIALVLLTYYLFFQAARRPDGKRLKPGEEEKGSG